ncbi:unnamed protein product [Ophioblennius macclurei]
MKGTGEAASIPLSSPMGGSGGGGGSVVQVDHDYQRLLFKLFHENGHAVKNRSYGRRERLSRTPDLVSRSQEVIIKDESAFRGAAWATDSSSQAYSDASTDPHDTLTETSTLTLMMENHNLQGAETVVYLKEFVLIDDDDDGDMSLREKTVTDFSVMDGKAAELVCGRLLSTSSCSLSECKEETQTSEAPLPEKEDEEEDTRREKHCCFCTLL